jgi:diadenylate cyclase
VLEVLGRLFEGRPPQQVVRDVVDVIIVAWVIYRALLVLRGTRAIQMAIGLGIVLLVSLGAQVLKLATLHGLLSSLLSSIVLVIVVVFQNDIRRALIRMGNTAWFSGGREQQSRVIDEVVAAATELARHRMGALIAFEQDANVLEFTKSEGIQLDSVVTRELLVSLFVPESVNKLHDGAVLIRDLKIARAGVFFPMPDTKILDAQLGSRHRAALGITEETDAVVVVVSEERGTISFCFSGNIVSNLDGQSLRHALLGLFGRAARKKRPGAKKAISPTAPSTGAPSHSTTLRPPPPMSGGRPSGSITLGVPPAPTLGSATPKGAQPSKLIAPSTPMRQAEGPVTRRSDPRDADGPPPSTATPGPVSVGPRASTFVPTSPTTPKRPQEEGAAESPDDEP